MDFESIKNIYHVSHVAGIFEVFTLLTYLATVKQFNRAIFINAFSVFYCIFICAAGCFTAVRFIKRKKLKHISVSIFRFFFFIGFASWAMWNGYRQYIRNEQMLTFFAVLLILVCFVPIKPLESIAMIAIVYAGLYAVLKTVDGAVGIHKINYTVLALVSLLGMIVRYHSQIRTSERSVQLQKHNEQLAYNNRHDALTGLRNRYALNDDILEFAGQKITAFMVDINYFKEINDTYGHAVGDEILKETALNLRMLFHGSLCYRFGGDEFLIIDVGCKNEKKGTFSFSTSSFPDGKVVFSIGFVDGVPNNNEELFALLSEADVKLYEMKRFTHAPENGGHDRRKRS